MCGLVGMVFNTTNGCISSDAQAFEELLYVNALRGEDSTGVAAFFNNGEMHIIKDACEAHFFRNMKEFEELKRELVSKGKAVLGHNRKKTIGKIDPSTAHPFLIDNRYAFTHNGTLHNHKKLFDTEVDSEALGMHLTECEGDPRKLEKALEEVDGAYACAWIDQEKEQVYLLRNIERPLYIAKTNLGYVYASESWMIYLTLNRNRVKVDEIEVVEPNTLYTLSMSDKHGIDLTKEKLTLTKKSTPLTTNLHGTKVRGTMGTTALIPVGKDVSKNAFKRFRNKFLGQTISFYVDDYVEKRYPLKDGDWTIFGESGSLEFNHLVCGEVLGKTEDAVLEEYNHQLVYGKITNLEYDSKTKLVKIFVENVTLYRPSNAGKFQLEHLMH